MSEFESYESVLYECLRCGARMSLANLEERGGSVKCIMCSYRVLKKVKAPIVKRVKAI